MPAIERPEAARPMEPADAQLDLRAALPPGVAGAARGRLRLTIDAVHLHARPVRSLQVRLKWWGQEAHGPALAPGAAAVYGVACSQRALTRYLADAPVEASVWEGGKAVGACALSLAGLAGQGAAEVEASILAPGSGRRLGSLSAHATLRFAPGSPEAREPAAGHLFEAMLPAAERAAAAAPEGEGVDVALALDRWSDRQLAAEEQAYALMMLGGAPPGAQATPAQLLAALHGCAAAEKAASDWLSGAEAAQEPGVAALAAALLDGMQRDSRDGSEAVSIAAVARQAMACAPDASLQQLRLLLAALWQDSGGCLTLGSLRELCALLAVAEAASSGTEASSSAPSAPESPHALPAAAYQQAAADRWAGAAPAEQLSLSLQPPPPWQPPWQQAGSLWGAASQQAWPSPWGQDGACSGAFATVWPHAPLAPIGFPVEPQQSPLELTVGVPAALSGLPWAQQLAQPQPYVQQQQQQQPDIRRLSQAGEGPSTAANARRQELAALIERAEALHSDMGRALRVHGQLRAAAGAAKGKPGSSGSRAGGQRRSLEAGEAGGKENAAAGPPARLTAGRLGLSSAEQASSSARSDASSQSLAARPRAADPAAAAASPAALTASRSASLASGGSLAEGLRLAEQICAPAAEPAGPPVGCEGGPDVLHSLRLRLAALDLPLDANEQPGLQQPLRCWLVHRFPGKPGALQTLPLPRAERLELVALVQHELVLPGGSCLGSSLAPGSLRFELWQACSAAAAPVAAGELPLAAVARLELPPGSREAEAAACAAHACSLPLRPLCCAADGPGAALPPVLHLQLEYAVQAVRGDPATGPAACGVAGEAQPRGPVRLRAEVLRVCGLQTAVEEAADWLAGGDGGGSSLLAQAQRQGPRVYARLAWPDGCSCPEPGQAADSAPASPSACPELAHSEACSLAPGAAAAVCQQELCVELWHLASHREAAAAQLAAGGSSGGSSAGREVFLGRARLPLACLAHSQGCEQWLPLRSRRGRLAGGVLVRLSAVCNGSSPSAAGLLQAELPGAKEEAAPTMEARAAVRLTVHECLLPPERASAAAAGAACHLTGRLPGLLGCFRLEGWVAGSSSSTGQGRSVNFGSAQTLLVARSALPALLEQAAQLTLLQPAGKQPRAARRQLAAPAMRAVACASVPLGPADRPGSSAVREAPLFCPASGRLGSIRFSVQIEQASELPEDAASWQPRWRLCPPASAPASPQPEAAEALQEGKASEAAEKARPGSGAADPPGSSAAPASEQQAGKAASSSADGSQEQQALQLRAAQAAAQPAAQLAGPRLRIESAVLSQLPASAAGSDAALAVEAAAACGWVCRTPAAAPAADPQAGGASAVWDHAASLPAAPVPQLLTLKVLAVAEAQPHGSGAGELLGTARVSLAALPALREVRGWYDLTAPGGGSAGQIRVSVTAADAPQRPPAPSPPPAALPLGSASELRGALQTNLQELDGLLAQLGAAPARVSGPGSRAPELPAGSMQAAAPSAVQPGPPEAAAAVAQPAAEPPAEPASQAASAGSQPWEEGGSEAGSPAAADWQDWEPELESVQLSELLRGLDCGDGSSFLDPDFDLALPGASPTGSAAALLLAAEAAEAEAASIGEWAAAEAPQLPGGLRTCSDDEGGAVDLSCLAAASDSSSGGSGGGSPLADTAAASHSNAWSLGAGALMLGGGADDWLFTISRRSSRASDAAQPSQPPEPAAAEPDSRAAAASQPAAGLPGSDAAAAAADAGWQLVASPGRRSAAAAQQAGGERGPEPPALGLRRDSGEAAEAETADTSSLGVETLTTSSEALPEGAEGLEGRASLSLSRAASDAAGSVGSASGDAEAHGWEVPPLPPDAHEPAQQFVSELGPPAPGAASPREHPLLHFDPFSQAPPSPPGLRFDSFDSGSMRTFAPAEFAAELECPPSPGRSSGESRRSGSLGRQPLRSPRWRGPARAQASAPLLPELGSLGSLHSLPEAEEAPLQPPPAGRPAAEPRAQRSSASTPLFAAPDARLPLATPYDCSLASSEEAWDTPLLSPLHLVREPLRSSGGSGSQARPAARERLPPRPCSAPPRTPTGAAARAPEARQSPRDGASAGAGAARPAHSRSQPELEPAATAAEAARADAGAEADCPTSSEACEQARPADGSAVQPPEPSCSAALPEPQPAQADAAGSSEAGSSPERQPASEGVQQPAPEDRDPPAAAPAPELPAKRLSEACTQTEPLTPEPGGSISEQPEAAAAAERAATPQPQAAPQQAADSCSAAPQSSAAERQTSGWPFDQCEPGSGRPVRHESGAPSFDDWQVPADTPAPLPGSLACKRPPWTAPQPAVASSSSSQPAPSGKPIGTSAMPAEAAAASRRPHTAAAAAAPVHSFAITQQRFQPGELLSREGGALLGRQGRAFEPAIRPLRPAPRRQAFDREAARMAGLLHDEE